MIPRLNRKGRPAAIRQRRGCMQLYKGREGEPPFKIIAMARRPSPREARAARHLAYRRATRTLFGSRPSNGVDAARDRLWGWPESRGTTAGQLTAMHLESEQ
jgi:hypothetical protein